MFKHPGDTPAQQRALDDIGCGNNSPMMAKVTRDALLRKGLIHRIADRIIGSGPFAVHVEQFEMPIPVHIQWCAAVKAEGVAHPLYLKPVTLKDGRTGTVVEVYESGGAFEIELSGSSDHRGLVTVDADDIQL